MKATADWDSEQVRDDDWTKAWNTEDFIKAHDLLARLREAGYSVQRRSDDIFFKPELSDALMEECRGLVWPLAKILDDSLIAYLTADLASWKQKAEQLQEEMHGELSGLRAGDYEPMGTPIEVAADQGNGRHE